METKFKVGDIVKLADEYSSDGSTFNGARITRFEGNRLWYIATNGFEDWCDNEGWANTHLVIDKKSDYKPKTPTHVVVWDEGCGDPARFFTSDKEAREFIKELSEKSNVVKDSIVLAEVKSAIKVKVKISKSLISSQYKI